MQNKYNIILHTTTFCNYNCSYCDVVKDKKNLLKQDLNTIINFINLNKNKINKFKFFWWEPLIAWDNVKTIIDSTYKILWNKFEIVTNTVLLSDEVGEYFRNYFNIIFFSIDSENSFDYDKIFYFISKYNLKDKVYFNLIISPWKEKEAYEQFSYIYKIWYKNFNLLPVYFTKIWTKDNLVLLSQYTKNILDVSLLDKKIKLYWFQSNSWYNSSLINESLFIDIDLWVFYSDFVSTRIWKEIKKSLYIWNTKEISLGNIDISWYRDILFKFEEDYIYKIKWQRELHKIMDYFSNYLNIKDGL